MKNCDRFLAAVKITGCILSWLLFCSMITQCERNRALAEGNDVEFSIVQAGSHDAAAEYYSDDAGNVVFGVSNFSFDAPLLLSSPVSGTSVNLLGLSVDPHLPLFDELLAFGTGKSGPESEESFVKTLPL